MNYAHREIEQILGTDKFGILNVTKQAKDVQEGQAVFMLQRENVAPLFIWCEMKDGLSTACTIDRAGFSYAITPIGAILLVIAKIVSSPSD